MKEKLKKIYDKWMKIVYVIGNFNARIILTIFYFTLVLPYGLVFALTKIFKTGNKKTQSNWVIPGEKGNYKESIKEQF